MSSDLFLEILVYFLKHIKHINTFFNHNACISDMLPVHEDAIQLLQLGRAVSALQAASLQQV